MAYVKGQPFIPQFTDPATGLLMANGTVEFYLFDTSTPTNYYTDSAGTVGGTSLTLNSGGKPATDIFFDTTITYKIVVKNAAGAVLDTIKPYSVLSSGVEIYDTIADVQAADLGSTAAVQTLGYATAGDGGGAVYWADSSDNSTADDGFLCLVSNDNVRFKLAISDEYRPSWAGAVGDGSTDDVTAIQAAINAINTAGEGVLRGDLSKTYKITTELDLKTGVKLKDMNFSVDFAGNPDYALQALGTLGTSTTVSSDCAEGSTSLSVTSASGFSEGSYLLVQDPTRLGGRWPRTVAKITDITGTTITIDRPVGVEYLSANSCTVTPLSPVSEVGLENVSLTYTSTSTSKFAVNFENCVDVRVSDLTISGHAYTSNPTACVSIKSDNVLNLAVNDCTVDQNTNTVGGNAALFEGLNSSQVDGIKSHNTSFGVGIWYSWGVSSRGHICHGRVASGNRGVKVAGCQQVSVTDSILSKFDSGFKIEDTGRFKITGNTVTHCGAAVSSYGINVSHQQASGSSEIRPSLISSNSVYNQTGSGIYVDNNSAYTTVTDNIVRCTTSGGIYVDAANCIVSDNNVFDWQSSAGIAFEINNVVTGNSCISLNGALGSFECLSNPSDTDWTVFSKNTSSSNAIISNFAYFNRIAVCEGNAVSGLGQRIMWATAAPTVGTFTRGDKVYHSSPSASGNIGWVCTGSGTPGAWKSFGTIAT